MKHTIHAPARGRAFTIIELLVVVSIIALLIGILLPAISKARDQARVTASLANLRNLGTAHGVYGKEWNDRQLTFIDDGWSSMGNNGLNNINTYFAQCGQYPPPIILGWRAGSGGNNDSGGNRMWGYWPQPPNTGNAWRLEPIKFAGGALQYFGSFRICNAKQFSQYVSGKFYEKTFYAPKDNMVVSLIERDGCFDDPGEFCTLTNTTEGGVGWCSYVLSPAAMFAPEVMQNKDKGGWKNPFSMPGGFRSPAFAQCRYPSLKTHMLEHHWLQNKRTECNPAFAPGTYGGCEPWYFNHGWESQPATLFYDGHIEPVGTREAIRSDGRITVQMGWGTGWGLWSRDTTFGENGYLIDASYDQANTSYHILTTDGIQGRDFVAN